jgi:hypothetical protein
LHEINSVSGADRRASAILLAVSRDIHFWVPIIVLIAGLVLLRWVS